MKKLTDELIEKILNIGLLSVYEGSNDYGYYPKGIYLRTNKEWIDKNLPLEMHKFCKEYIIEKSLNGIEPGKFYVAPDFVSVLQYYKCADDKEDKMLKWYDYVDQFVNVIITKKIDYDEASIYKSKIQKLGLEIFHDLLRIHIKTLNIQSLLDNHFWTLVINFRDPNPKWITHVSDMLVQLFENTEDINQFVKLNTAPKYRENIHSLLTYKLLIKSLKKHAKDYSLLNIPSILLSRLRLTGVESAIVEVFNALKKYNYNEIKEISVHYFNHSKQQKVINFTKNILEVNGYFSDNTNKSFLINEHDTVLYSKNLQCDYSILKNIINNDTLLAETLLNLTINHCKNLWGDVSYKINYATSIINFEIVHTDKETVEKFKDNIIKYCDFAFSEAYLSPVRLEQLSFRDRGTRIEYENKKEIADSFHKELNSWLFMDKLDKIIPDKEEKGGRSKGKI